MKNKEDTLFFYIKLKIKVGRGFRIKQNGMRTPTQNILIEGKYGER